MNNSVKYTTTGLLQGLLVLSCVAHAAATPDWAGLYFGGFAGGVTPASISYTEPLRLDNNTNWFRPFYQSYQYDTGASFIGGATVGFNWMAGQTPWLLGLEGEYGYLNETGSSIDPNQIQYAAQTNNTVGPRPNLNGFVRHRDV